MPHAPTPTRRIHLSCFDDAHAAVLPCSSLLGTGCSTPSIPEGPEEREEDPREPAACDCVTPHSPTPPPLRPFFPSFSSLLLLVCHASPASPCPVAGFPPWFDLNLLFLKHLAPGFASAPSNKTTPPPSPSWSHACPPVSSASPVPAAHPRRRRQTQRHPPSSTVRATTWMNLNRL